MITRICKSKALTKYKSWECKCKFDAKNTIKHHAWEKRLIVICNPVTCTAKLVNI